MRRVISGELRLELAGGLELTGYFASPETSYSHAVVSDMEAAIAFAGRSKFPEHGLIVMGCVDGKPAPGLALFKDVVDDVALENAVGNVVAKCGAAFVEADMRADRNPTRMRAIERAASDLVRRFLNQCPACAHPGFDVTERIAGLPCEWCGEPTHVICAEVLNCQACAYRQERPPRPQRPQILDAARAATLEPAVLLSLERLWRDQGATGIITSLRRMNQRVQGGSY